MSQNEIINKVLTKQNNLIKNAKINWKQADIPVSALFDDIYFSTQDGLTESRYVFLEQNNLPTRWQEFAQRRFVIAETGFGTGLNFLATWDAFVKFKQQHPQSQLQELHFISFEKYPLTLEDLQKSHAKWCDLLPYAQELQEHYPLSLPECHRLILADGLITLDLWFGDVNDTLSLVPSHEEGIVDAWFLDGFAPSKNPQMWSNILFENMTRLSKQGCSLASFTSAGTVRRGLGDAQFKISKVKGFAHKQEMITGIFDPQNRASAKTTIDVSESLQEMNLAHVDRKSIKKKILDAALLTKPASDLSSIAIIGGGIASAALTKALVQRGLQVTLYCKDAMPALGASSNNQGALYPLLGQQTEPVTRIFAPSFLFAKQFVVQAAKYFNFDHNLCGVTNLLWNKEVTDRAHKILADNTYESLIQYLDIKNTYEKIGLPTNLASIFYPLGGWLAPQQFTQGMFKNFEQKSNFTACFKHNVSSLTQNSDNSWNVHVGEQTFKHTCVIVANGAFFNEFTQTQDLPLSQVKGQVSHIPTTQNLSKLQTVLCYDGYMTPVNEKNQHHCIGASYDRTNIDCQFDPLAQQENKDKLLRSIPNQNWVFDVDVSLNEAKQGIRCVSRDHLPFIGGLLNLTYIGKGELTQYNNLFCMLGLGSRGLCLAPLLAEILASQICGDPIALASDLLVKLHPSRMVLRKILK